MDSNVYASLDTTFLVRDLSEYGVIALHWLVAHTGPMWPSIVGFVLGTVHVHKHRD